MIWNIIYSGIETLAQMVISFGIFNEVYGIKQKCNKFYKIMLVTLLVAVYLFKTYANSICILSINSIPMSFLIDAFVLRVLVGPKFSRIIPWYIFYQSTYMLLKLPILIINGLCSENSLSEIDLINNPPIWTKMISCFIFAVLLIIYEVKKEEVNKIFANISYQRLFFSLIGIIEYILLFYILNMSWESFSIHTLILTISLILLLFMTILSLIVALEYQMMVRVNHLLRSKENSMQANYELISQEIERNRKINHDKKYDLDFLYHCLMEKEYEKGLEYINQKNLHYNSIQKNVTWTGYGIVDFLINRAKARTDEKKILFTIDVNILEMPMAEYDFFTILSNLLDNAIEAAEHCKSGEGYIILKLYSLNNVFKIALKNNYAIEPCKSGKRFVSIKTNTDIHGWGIENVKEIVNKYEGVLDIKFGNKIFLVEIILIQ